MQIPLMNIAWDRLSVRLPILIALFAAMTGLVAGGIAYSIARQGFIDTAKDRMELVRNERARAVNVFIHDTRMGLASLATRPGMGEDIVDLSRALNIAPAQRAAIVQAYTDGNPYPPGTRAALEDSGDGSGYSAKHKIVHDRLLRLFQLKELDDLLLVDARGTVVYSTMKESDFGANYLTGPLKETNAAQVFRTALASPEPAFADMAPYGPSGGPVLFMGQSIRTHDGAIAGVMMFQMKNSKIRDVANHIQDLGDTGEVYLVGPGATRRSQTRFTQGALLTEKIDTESAVRSAGGFTASVVTKDYKGDDVVSAYAPIDLMGVRWGIVSKIDLDEALAPLRTMALATAAGTVLSTLLIAMLGYAIARRISSPLDQSLRVMEKLSRGDLNVEIEDVGGAAETRQISGALKIFQGNLRETQRLVNEVTQNQGRLTGLLDSSPTGIIVISEDSEVLFVNDSGALILGKQKSAFIGQRFSFGDIAVNRAETLQAIAVARRDGAIKAAQFVIPNGEGSEMILHVSSRRTMFRDKEAFLIWFDDVTAQRNAEAELRESQQLLSGVIQNSSTVIFVKRHGRYIMVNKAWEALTGVPAAKARERTDLDVFPAEFARQIMENDAAVISSRKPAEFEERVKTADKDILYLSIKFPFFNADGEVDGICGMSTDITERKQLQLQIEAALANAKLERARADAILAGTPDPIVIVRSDSVIEYVNAQVQRVLGYSPEEIVGRRIEEIIPQRFQSGHSSQVRGFFETGHLRQMGAGRELFALARDGREIPVEIALSPIKAGDKPVVVALMRDITEQKAADKTIREARDAAEAATRAKSEFLASMSHEIRTPMNGITGMADLLSQTGLDDEQQHMVRTIRESGNALITVINDILDFSKIEAGRLDLESVTMSIVDAVEGVASTLTPNAAKTGVRVHVYVDPKLPAAVHGDPTRLRQILFNLGGNAVKFSDGNDIQIRAGFAGKSDDKRTWLRFSVIDRGIGISRENQAKLFQAFSQAESSTTRRFGGTGLGLAICRRLTEMLGGAIGVDSAEGKGSTFWVELPFETAESAPSRQKDRDLHGLSVMVVGSEDPRADAIDSYLQHWGATVVSAPDSAAAAAALKAGKTFDALMLDCGLDAAVQEKAVVALRKITEGKIPTIVLQDFQNRGARILSKDVVGIDANPLIRYRVISAVAVAAGRASPEIKTEDDALRVKPAKAPTVEEARANGQLILLAEDNLTNQDVIRRQLNMIGYACEIAGNGREALKVYQKEQHALLLTDCHMPEMDGYELTGAIRKREHGTGQRLPIIAVTANALQGEAERCLASGMDDYISKPIAMPALVAALKKWMHPERAVPKPEAVPIRVAQIDERAIKDTFGDDDAVFREIMQSFLGPSEAIVADIVAAWEKRSAGDVKDAAHKLKSSARTIGANALADMCAALEAAGKASDWKIIDTLAPQARDEFAGVARYIERL